MGRGEGGARGLASCYVSTGSPVPDLTNLTMGGWLAGLFGVKSRGKGGEILSL